MKEFFRFTFLGFNDYEPQRRFPFRLLIACFLVFVLLVSLFTVPPGIGSPAFATTPTPESCRALDGADSKLNGHYIQNQIRLEPIFAKRMYADFRAGYDAMYIGYRITNNGTTAMTDAWITLDGWGSSPVVSLSNSREGEQRIGSLAVDATVTKFFLVKASAYSAANQSHTVRLWKDGYRTTEQLACTSTIQGVQRSISARANKVTSVVADPPVLGEEMDITVTGAPGTVGQGSAPDGAVMTLSPTNYAAWPSTALRLTKISAAINTTQPKWNDCRDTNGGGLQIRGSGNIRTVVFEDRLILRDFQQCGSNKGAYTITYTFKVIGSFAINPAIVPVSDISSGTQIKYTGGYPSTTEEVAFSDITVPDSVSEARVTKDYVDNSARFMPGDNNRLLLDYRIAASLPSTPTQTLTLDELLDNAPPGATIVSSAIADIGTARGATPPSFTDVTRTTATSITAREGGTVDAPEIRFVGPFTLSQTTSMVLNYTISVPVVADADNTYLNSAFGFFGSYIVGSGENRVSGIRLTVTVEDGEIETVDEKVEVKKLPQTITFSPPAKLGEGSSVTLEGYSDSGLPLTYTVSDGSTCVVSEFDGVFTLTMVGQTCFVTAEQGGNGSYEAATPVERQIQSMPGQTISHTALALIENPSGTLDVSSTSLLQVTIVNLTPDECTATFVSFTAGSGVSRYTVTAKTNTGGACILLASQPGNEDFGAAPDLDIMIAMGVAQRVFFFASNPTTVQLPNPMPSQPPTTSLRAISYEGTGTGTTKTNLPITFTSRTPSVCGISSSVSDGDIESGFISSSGETSTTVTLLAAGECRIQGDQDGFTDAGVLSKYAAADPVIYSFTVLPSGQKVQVITLDNPGIKTYGDPVFLVQARSQTDASVSTGLLITFSIDSGPCLISSGTLTNGSTTAQISLQAGGECVVRASQGGNAEFQAAEPKTQTFTVSPKTISVAGLSIPARRYDASTTVVFSGTAVLEGVVPGDTTSQVAISAVPAATFTSANVGTETLTVSGLSLTGSKVSTSYRLNALVLSGTITQRLITLTPADQSIQADADAPSSCTILVSDDGMAAGDSVASPVCSYVGYAKSVPPATYDISLTSHSLLRDGVPVDSNYTVTLKTGILTTAAAVVEIRALNDETLDNFTIVYGTGFPDEKLKEPRAKKSDNTLVKGSFVHKLGLDVITTEKNLAVGSHTLTVEFIPDADETAVVNPTSRVVTVTKRPVTYDLTTPTKVYDGDDTVSLPGFSFAPVVDTPDSGVVAGDDISLQAPSQGRILGGAAVGVRTLEWNAPTIAGGKSGNYELVSPGPKTGEITARPLTVRAPDHPRLVGQPNPDFTLTALNGGIGEGLADGETLDVVLGANKAIVVENFVTDVAGSYPLRPEAPNASSNYAITMTKGTLFVASIDFTVEETDGVLDSRVVTCDCEGMQPNSIATITIFSEPLQLATITVDNDGSCPLTTATIPDSLPGGDHTLELRAEFPTGTEAIQTRAVRLETAGFIETDSSTPTGQPTRTPQSPEVPRLFQLFTPNSPSTVEPVEEPQTTPSTPFTPRTPGGAPWPLGLPGLRLLDLWPSLSQLSTRVGQDTVDFGETDGQAYPQVSSRLGAPITADLLSQQKLSGFVPGSRTSLEILGARTAARFVVTEVSLVDTQVLHRAIQLSIPTQASNFFSIDRVQSVDTPVTPRIWTDNERESLNQFFAASGLAAPANLNDFDLRTITTWMLIEASATTYAPGTEVFMVVTSEPIVIGSTVVDRNGEAALKGTIPVDLLVAGEHRVRLVGIRELEGAFVDAEGSVGLTDELLTEIKRFDLGTQSTIAVYGPNPGGGMHVATRVVPLPAEAPWWTLWIVAGAAIIAITARLTPRPRRMPRRVGSTVLALGALLPGLILGWQSTVVAVTWWSLGLGLVAAIIAALGPYRVSDRTSAYETAR